MRRGELWLANMDPVVGNETSGSRPVVIISSDEYNQLSFQLVIICPLTSKFKPYKSRIALKNGQAGLNKDSWIKTEEVKTISIKRLIRKMGDLSPDTLDQITQYIKIYLKIY
ncbi:MAG: type II toxin-antitoxin system PemK/MazF family toxin [Candidatus Humimicrobiaceae bacterium]